MDLFLRNKWYEKLSDSRFWCPNRRQSKTRYKNGHTCKTIENRREGYGRKSWVSVVRPETMPTGACEMLTGIRNSGK